MMGGWLVDVEEMLVGQINEGELFIKATPFVERLVSTLELRAPYAA